MLGHLIYIWREGGGIKYQIVHVFLLAGFDSTCNCLTSNLVGEWPEDFKWFNKRTDIFFTFSKWHAFCEKIICDMMLPLPVLKFINSPAFNDIVDKYIYKYSLPLTSHVHVLCIYSIIYKYSLSLEI